MANEKKQPQFDADFSPYSDVNQRAAAAQGLRFDPNKNAYVDEDGCLILDQFGQPY